MSYKQVKRGVLVFLFGLVCFVFGYLYFGSHLARLVSGGRPSPGAAPGPPAPVIRQLRALRRRIARDPKDEEAYTELGNLYFQANKFDSALALYEKAVKLDGKDILARNDLALCYHIAKREKEAFQQLDAALRISPESQHLWLTLGLVTYETGQIAKAREALNKAYRLNPKSEAGSAAKSMLASLPKK